MSHGLQVMNFLVRKSYTFSILFHHISSRKLTHLDTFFKEFNLEPNLYLRIRYQRYLGERTHEYDAPGWTCESLNPESLQKGELIFSTENTLRISIDEINLTRNLMKLDKYTFIP